MEGVLIGVGVAALLLCPILAVLLGVHALFFGAAVGLGLLAIANAW